MGEREIYLDFTSKVLNANNNNLRLKICVVGVGNFSPWIFIYWIHYTKSESDLYLYIRNHENELLKPVFKYIITFRIHKGYIVVKKFILKLSGIKIVFGNK